MRAMACDMVRLEVREMVRKPDAGKPDPQPITVRLEPADYSLLKEYAASQNTSLNAVVAEAVAQYNAKLGRQRAVDRITAFQRRLQESRPVGLDSVELLREMRDGRLTGKGSEPR